MMHHCRGRFAVLLYVYVCGRLIISILAMETRSTPQAARCTVASGQRPGAGGAAAGGWR